MTSSFPVRALHVFHELGGRPSFEIARVGARHENRSRLRSPFLGVTNEYEWSVGVDRRRQDADALVGQHAADVGQQAMPVQRLDLNRHDERGLR